MKRILTSFGFAAIFLIGVCSCSLHDDDKIEPTGNTEIDGFFQSSAYSRFATSYKVGKSNLKIERSIKQRSSDKRINIYLIPVIKKGRQVGLLEVVSKDNGAIYKTIYQNQENFNPERGGEIIIEINKQFVAKCEYTLTPSSRNGSGEFVGKVTEVADTKTTSSPIPLLRSRSEFEKEEDEGWWDCTARCYVEKKDEYDNTNKILCDMVAVLLDLCSPLTAAGCAIHCI